MLNQNWTFGRNARLNFSTPIPTASNNCSIGTLEGCATISDSAGNLLLYSDGTNVRDGLHNLITNTLLGDTSSTQSSIIVPDPGNSNQYYVFTTDGSSNSAPYNHFDGVRVDLSGPSFVTLASIMAMPSTVGLSPVEKLVAIQHANCRDYWVITMVQQAPLASNTGLGVFRVFLVDPSGVTHVGDTLLNQMLTSDLGYMKGSPNGQRLAITNGPNLSVLVYDFDNTTGVIDIPSQITIGNPNPDLLTYGLEFSPNSNLLYFGMLTQNAVAANIYQVDLTGALTPVSIGSYANPPGNGRYAIGALQLGPDGRIYIAKDSEQSLGAILNPDGVFPLCTVNWSFIALDPNTVCYLGLPNLLPNPCEDDCDCGCGCGGHACADEVAEANDDLATSAKEKEFEILANGQTLPSSGCVPARVQADFVPVFIMRWGDGPTDHFESHDTEIFYIQVQNPYSNVCFGDLKIFNIRVTPNQVNPDGSNALQVIPAEIVCFESIQPCEVVSRDFVLLIENSLPGPYQITFDYCIGSVVITGVGSGTTAFDIEVVKS